MNQVQEMVMMPPEAAVKYSNPTYAMDKVIDTIKTKRGVGRPRVAGAMTVHDRLVRSLTIALKIATLGAYNEKNNIRRSDGSPVPNSDVSQLIIHALSPGADKIGLEEFISWLRKADINPSIIVNDYIRTKLVGSPTLKRSQVDQPSEREHQTRLEQPEAHERPMPVLEREDIDVDQDSQMTTIDPANIRLPESESESEYADNVENIPSNQSQTFPKRLYSTGKRRNTNELRVKKNVPTKRTRWDNHGNA